jgi:hypothetical protein
MVTTNIVKQRPSLKRHNGFGLLEEARRRRKWALLLDEQ